jgi:hypothetical protein
MTALQDAKARAQQFVPSAPGLAGSALGGPAVPYAPRGMSSFARWFTDAAGTTLVAVVPPGQARQSLDTVLAHALAHQHDRDLLLLAPADGAAEFLRRLHLFTSTVRVITYADPAGPLTPRPVPARAHVLSDYRQLAPRPIVRHEVPEKQRAWVQPVIDEAERHGAKPVQTRRYVSWHHDGLQVLRLTSGPRSLHVMAGVKFKNPVAGPPHASERIDGPASAEQIAAWTRVVGFDCTQRDRNAPGLGLAEHLLQSRLEPGMLGLVDLPDPGRRVDSPDPAWEREHFGYRGRGREGFLDFLGIDPDGHLHVVETKVGADAGVLIQALDYAAWVEANEDQIRALRRWPARPTGSRVHVDLVLGRKPSTDTKLDQPLISGYLAGQLEVLTGDVPLRVFVCKDIHAKPLELEPVAAGDLFDSALAARPPVAARRWPARAEQAIRSHGGLPKVHRSVASALLPAALDAYAVLQRAGKLHRWVLSTRSSQAYALNLFAPLEHEGVVAVLNELGLPAVDAEPPVFEHVEHGDPLAEASVHSPHQTQVDVLLRGRDASGRALAAFVEVKLTETDFGHCSAFERAEGAHLENCIAPGLFGSDPSACWQLRNKGKGRRLYDVALGGVPVSLPAPSRSNGGCLVRTSLSQPMRNLALAHHCLAEGYAHRVVFALCAPSGYDGIWRRFAELRAAFPDTDTRSILALPALTVAQAHTDGGALLRARYPEPLL